MDDRKILESLPLPLARGYRRFRNASEVRERHDAAYCLFEIYLKYASSIAVARYLAGEAHDPFAAGGCAAPEAKVFDDIEVTDGFRDPGPAL